MKDIHSTNNHKFILDNQIEKYYDFKQIEKKPLRKSSKQDKNDSKRAAGGEIAV